MYICISNLTTIGLDNGLSLGWCQAIISTNGGILLIRPIGINFNEILIRIQTFSFKKMHMKMSSGKWWPFCGSHNVLIFSYRYLIVETFSWNKHGQGNMQHLDKVLQWSKTPWFHLQKWPAHQSHLTLNHDILNMFPLIRCGSLVGLNRLQIFWLMYM